MTEESDDHQIGGHQLSSSSIVPASTICDRWSRIEFFPDGRPRGDDFALRATRPTVSDLNGSISAMWDPFCSFTESEGLKQ